MREGVLPGEGLHVKACWIKSERRVLLRRSGVRGGCCCEGDSVLLVLGRVL